MRTTHSLPKTPKSKKSGHSGLLYAKRPCQNVFRQGRLTIEALLSSPFSKYPFSSLSQPSQAIGGRLLAVPISHAYLTHRFNPLAFQINAILPLLHFELPISQNLVTDFGIEFHRFGMALGIGINLAQEHAGGFRPLGILVSRPRGTRLGQIDIA